jgi:hypothetical protein
MVPRVLRNNPKLGIYADFSWAIILDEVDESTTRMILRARFNVGPRLSWLPYLPLILPADFLVARLMLRTIKQRVEGSRRQAAAPRPAPFLAHAHSPW